jgi:hypothetical protein
LPAAWKGNSAAKWRKLIFILLLKKSSEIGRDQKLRGGREIKMYRDRDVIIKVDKKK